MSEHPLFAYWDDRATSGNPNGAMRQQQQQQQSSSQSPSQQSQFHPNQNMAFAMGYGGEQSNAGNGHAAEDLDSLMTAPFGGFNPAMNPLGPPPTSFAYDEGGDPSSRQGAGQNQQAVMQLQQNLMLMLQQQQQQQNEQGSNAGGDSGGSKGRNTHKRQHLSHGHYQQMQALKSGNAGTNEDSGSDLLGSVFGTDEDPKSTEQYSHLFGAPLEGPEASASTPLSNGNTTQDRMNDQLSPSSSRLFALGAMVKPLSSNKPHQVTSSGDRVDHKITANSLGMSESSSDFMMKLFQSEKGTAFQQHDIQEQLQQQLLTPLTAPSNQGITRGGSATAALQRLHSGQQQPQPDMQQRQKNEMKNLDSYPGADQQQQLQQQLRNKQIQLRQLQQQVNNAPGNAIGGDLGPVSQPDNFGLPSTMLPPSVLASMFSVETQARKPKALPVKAGKSHIKARRRRLNIPQTKDSDDESDMKPQAVLCELLERRGYDKEHRFKADDSGYDAVPSPLQLASFGTQLVKAVQTSNTPLLSQLLQCGLSPNPCNQFRDSVFFDLVIKRSNLAVFKCFLNHGCDLQVVDGFGRTPLHHCCWASNFCRPIVESILERDPVQIFLEDKHGQTPLEYVRTDLHGAWNDFLEEVADKFWPIGGQLPRIVSPKDRRPDGHLADPPNALSVTLASMVSSGAVSLDQIAAMDDHTRRTYKN